MATTVQVSDDTLELLKKVKEETKSHSYDEAIRQIIILRACEKSLGGYLSKYSTKDPYKGVRDKHDRF